MVTLVGKSWDRQVADVLRTTDEENLLMISDSVRWLKEQGRRVVFDAEHFFDGHLSNRDYALSCLEAALTAGAEAVVLCDTRGGTLPDHVQRVVAQVVARFGAVAGIHCHDNSGCAVANSLAAVRAGAVQVQGCVNGYGERTGNANLCTLIPDLQLKMEMPVVSDGAAPPADPHRPRRRRDRQRGPAPLGAVYRHLGLHPQGRTARRRYGQGDLHLPAHRS